MAGIAVRRLVVTDEKGLLAGILALDDVVEFLSGIQEEDLAEKALIEIGCGMGRCGVEQAHYLTILAPGGSPGRGG